MHVGVGQPAKVSASQKEIGIRSISADGKTVCQRQLYGFTFSRLAPYESWEPFRDSARGHWNSYREKTDPRNVKRLAVRYVNRIEIPESPVELKDYFRTSPEVSPDLPQMMDGFFMQLRLPQPDVQALAVVNQTIVPADRPNTLGVILDIDVFCAESVPQEEKSIWDHFEALHLKKNEIFEACITDKTRELMS